MNRTLSTTNVPEFLKLLAHDLRWKILTALAQSDCSVQEMLQILQEPQNVVSYHLRKLREHHLVRERRSSADERSLYYSLDLNALRDIYLTTGNVLHPALGSLQIPPDVENWAQPEQPLRILILCTHNSARSQMAEALLRQISHGKIEVFSAGTEPAGVHPFTLEVLKRRGFTTNRLRSKHLEEFNGQSFDYVITVCDRVREICPSWPGEPECIHWSLPDPILEKGSIEERYEIFEQIATQLTVRIDYFLALIERKYHQKYPEKEGFGVA